MLIVGAATAVDCFITAAQIPAQMTQVFAPLVQMPNLLLFFPNLSLVPLKWLM